MDQDFRCVEQKYHIRVRPKTILQLHNPKFRQIEDTEFRLPA